MSVWETTTVQSIVTVLTLLVAIIALASLDIKMKKAWDMSAMVCQNTCISNYVRGFSNERLVCSHVPGGGCGLMCILHTRKCTHTTS